MTRIKARLVLFTDRNQKNTGLAEYFGSICYLRERVLEGSLQVCTARRMGASFMKRVSLKERCDGKGVNLAQLYQGNLIIFFREMPTS